jgi:hypothetical protein
MPVRPHQEIPYHSDARDGASNYRYVHKRALLLWELLEVQEGQQTRQAA